MAFKVGDKVKFVGSNGNYKDATIYTVACIYENGTFDVSWYNGRSYRSAKYLSNSVQSFMLIEPAPVTPLTDANWIIASDADIATLERYGVEFDRKQATVIRISHKEV